MSFEGIEGEAVIGGERNERLEKAELKRRERGREKIMKQKGEGNDNRETEERRINRKQICQKNRETNRKWKKD